MGGGVGSGVIARSATPQGLVSPERTAREALCRLPPAVVLTSCVSATGYRLPAEGGAEAVERTVVHVGLIGPCQR